MRFHYIFNYNGVIVNNDYIHKKLIFQIMKIDFGINLSDHEYEMFFSGKSDYEGFKNYFYFIGQNIDNQFILNTIQEKSNKYIYSISQIRDIIKVNEVVEFIKQKSASDYITIVGKSPLIEIDCILTLFSLQSFIDDIISFEDFSLDNFLSCAFLKAISNSKIPVENTIIFESSKDGVLAAKRTGAKCVGVLTTNDKEELKGADYIFSMKEIVGYFARLKNVHSFSDHQLI